VIGLFLAMVDLPDFSSPLRRIAGSVEKMAGVPPEDDPTEPPSETAAHAGTGVPDATKPGAAKSTLKTTAAVDEIKSKIQRDLKRGGPGNA
jgi:hypothetical protein